MQNKSQADKPSIEQHAGAEPQAKTAKGIIVHMAGAQPQAPTLRLIVEQPTAPQSHAFIPQEWGSTVSAVSALISALAFILSGMALRNTRKAARQTSFDNHYGDSIRTGLRELEEACGRLRVYSFPSKPLPDLKNELGGVQADIEEKGFQLENLLGEVDAANAVKCRGWSGEFAGQMEAAGLLLESATDAGVTTEIAFRGRVESARDLYRAAITAARTKLEVVRKKV